MFSLQRRSPTSWLVLLELPVPPGLGQQGAFLEVWSVTCSQSAEGLRAQAAPSQPPQQEAAWPEKALHAAPPAEASLLQAVGQPASVPLPP